MFGPTLGYLQNRNQIKKKTGGINIKAIIYISNSLYTVLIYYIIFYLVSEYNLI